MDNMLSVHSTNNDWPPVISCWGFIVNVALSRTIFEIDGNISKIFLPFTFNAPLTGFPLEFCNGRGAEMKHTRHNTGIGQTELINVTLCIHCLLTCDNK